MGHVTPRPTPPPRNAVLEYTGALPTGDRGAAVARNLVLAFLGFVVVGFLALQLPGVRVTGQEMGFRRALFASVNATTLTGFQQDVGSPQVGADVVRLVL